MMVKVTLTGAIMVEICDLDGALSWSYITELTALSDHFLSRFEIGWVIETISASKL